MGSFSQTRSPVLALPPQLPPQHSFAMENQRPMFTSPFTTNGVNSINPSPPLSAWPNRKPTFTPGSAAGRKRSRDTAADNLEDDEYFPNVQPSTLPAPDEDEEEWEYGEGMTLIKPNQHYAISAESQTGTWVEERVEPKQSPTPAQSPERPALRPHKSQRLNLTATSDIPEDVNLNNGRLMTPLCSTSVNGLNPNSGPTEPTVDDFTRHLGVGWSSISPDIDIQAAVRGWTKYIENHYPVTGAKIRLQSRGLSGYLVEANEGYFLFGEDLKQGRLVSTSLDRIWENLRANPPVFDGEAILEAAATPKVDNGTQAEGVTMTATNALQQETGPWNNGSAVQNFHQPAVQSLEVEMDMS